MLYPPMGGRTKQFRPLGQQRANYITVIRIRSTERAVDKFSSFPLFRKIKNSFLVGFGSYFQIL